MAIQSLLLSLITLFGLSSSSLIITGVIDGPLPFGRPKAVELYALEDIADLSLYGVSSANNGGGTTGDADKLLSGSATAGDFLYMSTDLDGEDFNTFFGFYPDFVHGQATNINGDDAIELFFNGNVIDVFGEVDMSGTGESWEYVDGWVYRVDCTGPDGDTFEVNNFIYSGVDALEGETSNDVASVPFPIGSYQTCTPAPTEERP